MSELSCTLYVIPHLPVENNLRGVLAGLDDQPICEYEECLAALLYGLQHQHFAVVLSSPLRRSLETVSLCFDPAETPLRMDERLLPVNYGRFHGRLKREVGPINHEFAEQPFPEGESFRQVVVRYESFLTEVLPEYDGKDLALMGHEGSDAVLSQLCNGGTLEGHLRKADEARLKRLTSGVGRVGYYRSQPTGPFVFSRPEPDR